MLHAELDAILGAHQAWINNGKGRRANLRRANLRGADLRDANLDFSSWPLWCGSFGVKVDKRLAAQLAYHFCRLDCDDEEVEAAQLAVGEFANRFHRIGECARVKEESHDATTAAV